MTEPNSQPMLTPAPGSELAPQVPALSWRDLDRTQRRTIETMIAADRFNGATYAELAERYPMASVSTIKRVIREANWQSVDMSPEGLQEARERQAFEVRAQIYATLERLAELDEAASKSREGLETDTDRFVKLTNSLKQLQEREAKLLGLDSVIKVEHSGKIRMDFNPELETLVAELAGGGVLMSSPDQIVDGEVIDE